MWLSLTSQATSYFNNINIEEPLLLKGQFTPQKYTIVYALCKL